MVSFDVAAQRQLQGMQQGGQRLVDGYNAMTDHPGVKAAANQAGYLAGINRSVKKWAANVQGKHTLQDLKDRMKSKGQQAYTASAVTANAAYRRNAAAWYATIQTIKQQIDQQYPRGSDAQNTARMNAFNAAMIQARNAQLSGM